jgi:NADH-quinone oxidoreductase subunit K
MIGLQHYLTIAAMLFVLSIVGIVINRRNLILLLMCIELMLLAVNFNFVAFSRYLGDDTGQVFVFFILTVAAAEAAIGLAILVVLFRNRRSINVQESCLRRCSLPSGLVCSAKSLAEPAHIGSRYWRSDCPASCRSWS